MVPIIANVSFGVLALSPYGWVFMTAIIALECAAVSRLIVASTGSIRRYPGESCERRAGFHYFVGHQRRMVACGLVSAG
ncbi:MAG: hypothetical protein ACREIA_21980 [Opitutaceae bacterium]